MNAPLATGSQAAGGGSGKTACFVVGCVVALLFGLLLLAGGVGAWLYLQKGGGEPAQTLTITYKPELQPSLGIGSGGVVGENDWPPSVEDFLFTSVKPAAEPNFGLFLAGATYAVDESRPVISVHFLAAATSEQYSRLANALSHEVGASKEGSEQLTENFSIFSSPSFPLSRFLLRPLREHAIYFRVDYPNEEAAEVDAPVETVSPLLVALTRAPALEEAKPEAPKPETLIPDAPKSAEPQGEATPQMRPLGFPSFDGDKGELPYPKGPSLAGKSVVWLDPDPDPSQNGFALVADEVEVPAPLADLGTSAVGYHALHFEKNVSLPFTGVFVPRGEGEDPEAGFQKVLKAFSEDGRNVLYDGFESFATIKGETNTAAVYVHHLHRGEAEIFVVPFADGVVVAIFDGPRGAEEIAAFPSLKEVAVAFYQDLSVFWMGGDWNF